MKAANNKGADQTARIWQKQFSHDTVHIEQVVAKKCYCLSSRNDIGPSSYISRKHTQPTAPVILLLSMIMLCFCCINTISRELISPVAFISREIQRLDQYSKHVNEVSPSQNKETQAFPPKTAPLIKALFSMFIYMLIKFFLPSPLPPTSSFGAELQCKVTLRFQ